MKYLIVLLLLCHLAFYPRCSSEEVYLSSIEYLATTCSGVWSQSVIPGGSPAYIQVTIGGGSHGQVAMAIYEWQDSHRIGVRDTNGEAIYVCSKKAEAEKLCDGAQIGQFIIQPNATSVLSAVFDVQSGKGEAALYKVEKTGFYCVIMAPSSNEDDTYFDAWVEWKHPYGRLPAMDYPKLLYYGIFSLIYLLVGVAWGIQSYRYWDDVLPVQHFLSGAIFYLTVEMTFNWGFWEAYNQTGKASYGLLVLVALLNAGRTSISFFMLLIVCMGYSVVKPQLGSTMKHCAILACAHFFFGVIYSLGTMLLSPESAGFLMLLVVFPLSITMTIFYIWTLNSIASTLRILEMRKQHVKVLMYKRLYRLLLFSVIMVALVFVVNIFNFSDRKSSDWTSRNWKWRWFLLDGMLNILYFIVFFVIVILWKPTENNHRYGLEQISQDEEEALALENNLRMHSTNHGLGLKNLHDEDDAAIFELGGDASDNEYDDRYKHSIHPTDASDRRPLIADDE
ncbi:lung seven transmembrane receptor-domain-containing protein [Fennellomyces sp. T-0311]|nr:lung seven transmembrane receptor-domain-containing protein [Fennellomyces sp. T-0311]